MRPILIDNHTGYIYGDTADIGGSEAVGLVTDGQDQEMIEAVESECEYLGFVRSFREANEGHRP